MIHDILEWERSSSPREYAELEGALKLTSSSAIRSSSSPKSKYEFNFTKASLSDYVNQDFVFIPMPEEFAYSKLLEEITLTEKLEEEMSTRTRCHLSGRFSRKRLVPRCGCWSYYDHRTRLGRPRKAPVWVLKFPAMAKFYEGLINRCRCDSLEEDEADNSKDAARIPEDASMT